MLVFPNVHIEELRNKTLEVTVWDYDRFKANDFLGEVVIDFSGETLLRAGFVYTDSSLLDCDTSTRLIKMRSSL